VLLLVVVVVVLLPSPPWVTLFFILSANLKLGLTGCT